MLFKVWKIPITSCLKLFTYLGTLVVVLVLSYKNGGGFQENTEKRQLKSRLWRLGSLVTRCKMVIFNLNSKELKLYLPLYLIYKKVRTKEVSHYTKHLLLLNNLTTHRKVR